MAIVDDLKTRRDAVAAKIAALDSTNFDLPNATGAHAVDFESHKRGLYAELRELNELIADHDTGEVISYGVI